MGSIHINIPISLSPADAIIIGLVGDEEFVKIATKRTKPQVGQLALFALPTPSQGLMPPGERLTQDFTTPVDEDEALRLLRRTKGQAAAEVEVWKKYNAAKNAKERKIPFRQLLNGGAHGSGYRPLLYGSIGRRYMVDNQLPEAAVKAELTRTFKKALDTYDPTKGFQLNTWVWNNAKKTSRFVNRYSQMGRIPEDRLKMVRQLRVTREEMEDRLGRDPSDEELAEKLGWRMKDVKLVTTETRADILEQEGVEFGSQEQAGLSEAMDLLHRIRPNLDDEAQRVLDHTYGMNGKREITNNNELARTMGLTANRVRAIKRKVAREVAKHRG